MQSPLCSSCLCCHS